MYRCGSGSFKSDRERNLQENALVVGSHLKKRLTELKDKYESKLPHILFCAAIKHDDH